MALKRLYLKDGVDPAGAARSLRAGIVNGANIAGASAGFGPTAMRDAYLEWVEAIEVQLRHFTLDAEVVTMFQTARYGHIRNLEMASPRPWPLVEGEIAAQTGVLQEFVDDLQRRIDRISAAPGHLTVLDTNILLEYQQPKNVPWPTVVGQKAVRLVVPLRVVEELDGKKYARRDDLASRARRSLRLLAEVVGSGGVPGQLRPDVTIEVPVDPGARRRPADADEEVLDTCQELRQLAGHDVSLVTADIAMRLRAEALGISVVRMPPEYERQRPDAQPAA